MERVTIIGVIKLLQVYLNNNNNPSRAAQEANSVYAKQIGVKQSARRLRGNGLNQTTWVQSQ